MHGKGARTRAVLLPSAPCGQLSNKCAQVGGACQCRHFVRRKAASQRARELSPLGLERGLVAGNASKSRLILQKSIQKAHFLTLVLTERFEVRILFGGAPG